MQDRSTDITNKTFENVQSANQTPMACKLINRHRQDFENYTKTLTVSETCVQKPLSRYTDRQYRLLKSFASTFHSVWKYTISDWVLITICLGIFWPTIYYQQKPINVTYVYFMELIIVYCISTFKYVSNINFKIVRSSRPKTP